MATIPELREAVLALALILGTGGCTPPGDTVVVVSGKTVFRGMAVEEVLLQAFPVPVQGGRPADRGRSGYHGSFSLRLAPGNYRLTARGTLPGPGGVDRALEGTRPLEVRAGTRRLDRVVVELREPNVPRP